MRFGRIDHSLTRASQVVFQRLSFQSGLISAVGFASHELVSELWLEGMRAWRGPMGLFLPLPLC
jgi:hypothetical protein